MVTPKVKHKQLIAAKKQETRNKEQGTRNKKQGTRNKEQETRNKKQGTRNKEQETRNKKQGTRNKKQERFKKMKQHKNIALRYIPENSEKIEYPNYSAVAYLSHRGKYLQGIFYEGKRKNPTWNYIFSERERFEKACLNSITRIARNIEFKKEQKLAEQEKKEEFKAQLTPGVILVSSWGYEQTNVDFYQVIETKGSFVTLRKIAQKEIEQTGWASANVAASKDNFIGEKFRRKIMAGYVAISDCRTATLWNGKPTHCSWYH